jgi:hypothetical protein
VGFPTISKRPAVSNDLYWRWEDEPDSEPQLLGSVVPGHTLRVPFDLQGKAIRIFSISKSEKGNPATSLFSDSVQTTFIVDAPALTDLLFSAPDVTGTIETNTGTGDIHVLRKLSTDTEFSDIQTVAAGTPTFTDTPSINGDYMYKLTQEGLSGESNALSVTVTGGGGGAGTPPDGLSALFDGFDTVNLSWTNHGGTGNNVIELKYGSGGSWYTAGEVAFGANSYADTETKGFTTYVVYYRYNTVYNADVAAIQTRSTSRLIPRE